MHNYHTVERAQVMLPIEVSNHYKDGKHVGFKKFIYGKNHHLITGTTTEHQAYAKRLAAQLIQKADELRAEGRSWDPDVMASARIAAGPRPDEVRPTSPVMPPQPTPAAALPPGIVSVPVDHTIQSAVDRFTEFHRQRLKNDEISDEQFDTVKRRVDRCALVLGAARTFSSLTTDDLDAARGAFTSRPEVRVGQRMSLQTALNYLKAMKQFFDWSVRKLRVTLPDEWQDCLKLPEKLKRDLKSKRSRPKAQFHLAELQFYWHHAVPRTKLLLGLGLWCGFNPKDIAFLRFTEIFNKDGEVTIRRARTKTGVSGQWLLPKPVADLLLKEIAKTPRDKERNPQGLALLGANGHPLIHHGVALGVRKHKCNVVNLAWNQVMEWAQKNGVRRLSFGKLRKTGAQWMRNQLGKEFSQLFLAHVQADLCTENYTDPAWATYFEGTRAIHQKMSRMFEKLDWVSTKSELLSIYKEASAA